MPQAQQFKVGLSGARFPLLHKWASQAVLVPAMDQVQRTQFVGDTGDPSTKDYNVPEIIYGENFIPTAQGVRSVTYKQVGNANNTLTQFYEQMLKMRDDSGNLTYLSPAGGQNYILNTSTKTWSGTSISTILTAAGLTLSTNCSLSQSALNATSAYVDGYTIVCYPALYNQGGTRDVSLYQWDQSLSKLDLIALNANTGIVQNLASGQIAGGIPIGGIDGVAASNGYLLVWSGETIYWAPYNATGSSSFDFNTFANGNFTGSGSEIPNDLLGPITAVAPVSGGFIIFSQKNAVAAYYTPQNTQLPWTFRKVSGAGGVASCQQVTIDDIAGNVIAYTTAGLQQISLQEAEAIHPEVSAFLGAQYIEFWQRSSASFVEGTIPAPLFVKVVQIDNKFLVISYGSSPGVYSFALIYDAGLKRWGKLRMVHVDCFSFTDIARVVNANSLTNYDVTNPLATFATEGVTRAYQSVAFLQKDGTIWQAVMDNSSRDATDTSLALVMIGKIQFSRSRYCSLHGVQIAEYSQGWINGAPTCTVYTSLDGQNLGTATAGTLRQQTGNYAEFGFPLPEGVDFITYIEGQFDLNTLIFKAQPMGDR